MSLIPIESILDFGKTLIERFIPDPQARAAAAQKLLEMQQSGDLQIIANQIKLNEAEATNPRLFVSGWRPFVGWVCGTALAVQLVLGPIMVWVCKMSGHPIEMLVMDNSLLTTMLVGMLGLGGMRTVEKLNGVAAK